MAFVPAIARAQACCAASAALTPGRLAVHEDALIGLQARASVLTGSYDEGGAYASSPSHTSELDFEQDLIGTARVLPRAQLAALIPMVETRRQQGAITGSGFGFGDVNVGARYDFVLAGERVAIPGIALLLGVTLPTGRPPERATHAHAADATGIGATQGTIGVAFERSFGAVLFNASAFVSKRASRTVGDVRSTLGPQLTALLAAAYTFDSEAALALVATYSLEGNAVIDDREIAGSGRRSTTIALAGLLPLSATMRLQGSVFTSPPLPYLGRNQPATSGLTLTVIRSWS